MSHIEPSDNLCIVGCGDVGSMLIGKLPPLEQTYRPIAVNLDWSGSFQTSTPRTHPYIDLGDKRAPRGLFDPTDEYLFSHARDAVDEQIDLVLDAIGQANAVLLMGMAAGRTAAGIVLGVAQNLLIRGIPTAVALGMPAYFEGKYRERRAEALHERLSIGGRSTTRIEFARGEVQGMGFAEAFKYMDHKIIVTTCAVARRLAGGGQTCNFPGGNANRRGGWL